MRQDTHQSGLLITSNTHTELDIEIMYYCLPSMDGWQGSVHDTDEPQQPN